MANHDRRLAAAETRLAELDAALAPRCKAPGCPDGPPLVKVWLDIPGNPCPWADPCPECGARARPIVLDLAAETF